MIFSCFTRRSFQNVLRPWWTYYNDFYPVATEATSNLLSLAWRLRLHPIVGSNDPEPHPKCAVSARKCIAQYRLKCQIIHCQIFFWIRPCYRLVWKARGLYTKLILFKGFTDFNHYLVYFCGERLYSVAGNYHI